MRRVLSFFVSLVLLVIALFLLDWDSLKLSFLKVDLWIFGLSIILSFSQFLIMGVRWYQIISKIIPLPLFEHMRKYLYSVFLNTFTPANLGGDMYRYLLLKSKTSDRAPVLMSLLKERVLGLLSFLLVYLFSLLFLWSYNPQMLHRSNIFSYMGVLTSLSTAGIILSPFLISHISRVKIICSRPRTARILSNLHKAVDFHSPIDFIRLIGLSLISLFVWIFTVKVIARALDIGISLWILGLIVVLVELARLLPINIQGIGIREGAFAYLFNVIGESPEAGFALGTISYLALSFSIIFSGIVGKALSAVSIKEHGYSDIVR